MAEEEKGKESSKAGEPKSVMMTPEQPDPKIGLVGMKSWVRDWVVKVIFDNLPKGMEAIGKRIEAGDIAMIKFVMDFLQRFEDEKEDPHLVLQSFAEFLMTELKELPAETGEKAGAEAPASA